MRNYKLISLFLISQLLVACTQNSDKINSEETIKKNNDQVSSNPSLSLNIDHRCIGCGKCVVVDQEHFAQNGRHQIATVISQDNLDSDKLEQAINICPANAISLN